MSITYLKEIPTELLNQEGGFTESNKITVKLDNSEKVEGNPETGFSASLIVVILSGVVAVGIILVSLKRKKINAFVLLLALGIVPFSYGVGAVSSNLSFCYYHDGNYSLHEYEEEMTWMQYINSEYNIENFFVLPQNPIVPWGSTSSEKILNFMGHHKIMEVLSLMQEVLPMLLKQKMI